MRPKNQKKERKRKWKKNQQERNPKKKKIQKQLFDESRGCCVVFGEWKAERESEAAFWSQGRKGCENE